MGFIILKRGVETYRTGNSKIRAYMIPIPDFGVSLISQITVGEAATVVVLGITAVIVWKYTKAVQESNEIAQRPVVNLYLRNNGDSLALRNVGNSSAYNIKVQDITLVTVPDDPSESTRVYRLNLTDFNTILESKGGQGDERLLYVEVKHLGQEKFKEVPTSEFLQSLIRIAQRGDKSFADFYISYEGVTGKRYYSYFKVYNPEPPRPTWSIDFVERGIVDLKHLLGKQGRLVAEKISAWYKGVGCVRK